MQRAQNKQEVETRSVKGRRRAEDFLSCNEFFGLHSGFSEDSPGTWTDMRTEDVFKEFTKSSFLTSTEE
ncbi:uncharacterized protein V6R79_016800 [Siganus canaliculatus]